MNHYRCRHRQTRLSEMRDSSEDISRLRQATSLLLVCLFVSLAACAGDDDDSNSCSDEELYVAEACESEEYCGAPIARVGTGGTSFEAVDEGQDVPIWYGSQGGYHVFYSVEMENLCPVVFLRISMLVDLGDGDLLEVHEQERHVQAVRLQPQSSSLQSYWGVNGFLPCEYWPLDPDNSPTCSGGAGSAGHLEDYEVVMRVEAEDHNGRIATDEKRVQPVCCSN